MQDHAATHRRAPRQRFSGGRDIFIEKQPVILQESMVVGRKWGEEMAQKAIDEIRRKGYGKKR